MIFSISSRVLLNRKMHLYSITLHSSVRSCCICSSAIRTKLLEYCITFLPSNYLLSELSFCCSFFRSMIVAARCLLPFAILPNLSANTRNSAASSSSSIARCWSRVTNSSSNVPSVRSFPGGGGGEITSWVSSSGVNKPPLVGLDRCGEGNRRNEISSSMPVGSVAEFESTPFIWSITLWKFRTADGEMSELG